MYLFRIKPQFTNHSSRDFDSDGNETLAETETRACSTCTSRGTSFAKPRTAQRCLGREFTAAVITSCTRRWEIALQAAGGLFKEVFPDISSMCWNHWSWFLALASGFIDSDYCKTCMLFSKLYMTRRAWIIFNVSTYQSDFNEWDFFVSHFLQSGGKRACGFSNVNLSNYQEKRLWPRTNCHQQTNEKHTFSKLMSTQLFWDEHIFGSGECWRGVCRLRKSRTWRSWCNSSGSIDADGRFSLIVVKGFGHFEDWQQNAANGLSTFVFFIVTLAPP